MKRLATAGCQLLAGCLVVGVYILTESIAYSILTLIASSLVLGVLSAKGVIE